MRAALRRLDDTVAAIERALVVGLLAVMVGAVFLDALHRTFSAEQGRTERLLVWLAPAAIEGFVRRALAPALLAAATFAIAYAAVRARAPERRRGHAALLAAVATGALTAATQLLVRALPAGLVWSQQMALCFLLWAGLLGASLGARDRAHIAFELASRLWPGRLARPAEVIARVVAGGFTLMLAVLAAAFAREHHLEWTSSDGAAGLFEGFRVPRFVIYGFLPLPLAVTGLRLLGYGVRASESAPATEPPR